MKEKVGDVIFNIFAKPFGIRRVRTGDTVQDIFQKREGWMPQSVKSIPHVGKRETVTQTGKEIVFTKKV